MDAPPPPPQPTPPAASPAPVSTVAPPPSANSVKPEAPEPIEVATASPPFPSPPAAITIPSYSRWFSWTEIHDTERRILPEFFDGKSSWRNPSVYKYYRDSIIRRCWESPSRRICFTETRRCLVGDVGSIRRVFDFLESWGLINYTPSSKQGAFKGGEEKKAAEEAAAAAEKKESPARRVCTSCGTVCSQVCFATDKQVEIILCSRCFVRGNYRAGLTSGDFKRLDTGEESIGERKPEWTDKETLHLLEAVLHYGDDWKKVTEHVGNGKSQKDCLARFVKLPFGEQFLGSIGTGQHGGDNLKDNLSRDENGDTSDELSPAKRMRLSPLADASNPIMAQVTFLSAMVGSEVAEAAAEAAVKALYEVEDTSLNDVNDNKNDNEADGGEGSDGNKSAASLIAFDEAVSEARQQLDREHEDGVQSITDIVEVQMKKMQEKILHFEEMELLIEKERSQLQYLKSMFFADQLSLLQLKARYKSVDATGPEKISAVKSEAL